MIEVNPDLVIRFRLAFKLTDSLAKLLGLLANGQVVSNDEIIAAGATVAPAVGISRLRKALQRAEVPVRIEVGTNIGYWLSVHDKEKIMSLSEPYTLKRDLPQEVTNDVPQS